jgi:hypothetical protein
MNASNERDDDEESETNENESNSEEASEDVSKKADIIEN